MTKKKAHIILSILDLLIIEGIITFYYDFRQIILDTSNHVEMISFSNRMGFFILGVGLLIIHLMVIVEHFKPELIKKNNKILNVGLIALAIALFTTAFTGSEWIKSKVENAGYVYCRKASGASALAKTLVYTKNMEICEELVETKRKQ
jgi:amino acid permease